MWRQWCTRGVCQIWCFDSNYSLNSPMVMKWCTKFAGLIIGVIQVKKLPAICRPVFLSICLMENIMEGHDFSIFILHYLMENVMENFMEVHNFSIFILRFFSIFSPYSFPLYGEKAEMNTEKISDFSPLSSIKSRVSILPIIWRKSGNEYGENFRFFHRFFSIMIFSLFSAFSPLFFHKKRSLNTPIHKIFRF